MKITLVMVMSANGKTTRGDAGPITWASVEDQKHFETLKANAPVIIMGRKTHDSIKPHLLDDGKVRIVMSRSGGTPEQVVADLEGKGFLEALLVGGSELNASFFEAKLVSEIYLTIEPKIFGSGLPLAQAIGHEVELELINVKQLNPRGTLLLHYNVK